MEINKQTTGKKSRVAGQRFEKRVREDLEKRGWIVAKWSNNVSDYPEDNINKPPEKREDRQLIPARPKFTYNPLIKRRLPMGMSSGFPDFIAFREMCTEAQNINHEYILGYEIIGIEAKMNGKLDKQEKDKCEWLLKNVFQRILIAQKGIKRGEIRYKEFPGGEKMADEGTQTADPIEEYEDDEYEDDESEDEESDEDSDY